MRYALTPGKVKRRNQTWTLVIYLQIFRILHINHGAATYQPYSLVFQKQRALYHGILVITPNQSDVDDFLIFGCRAYTENGPATRFLGIEIERRPEDVGELKTTYGGSPSAPITSRCSWPLLRFRRSLVLELGTLLLCTGDGKARDNWPGQVSKDHPPLELRLSFHIYDAE